MTTYLLIELVLHGLMTESGVMFRLVLIYSVISKTSGANILGIFPFTAKSHFTMYDRLLEELHDRGHNLTVMSHFPLKSPKRDYYDVSLVGTTPSLHGNLSLSHLNNAPLGIKDNLREMHPSVDIAESMMKSSQVQNLLNSGSKFDLVIIEMFNTDVFLAFSHKFNAPYISISPCPLLPWTHHRVENSRNPSYVPVFFSSFTNNMDVVSRGLNALYYGWSIFYYEQFMATESERLARRYFPGSPPLYQIAQDVSLILVNTHNSLHRPPPSSPRVIEVGGMHVKPAEPLRDKTLLDFLETAEHGVILFSMGSMFRAESLSKEKQTIFEKVLKSVKQRVIWKRESTTGKAIDGNVLFMDWVPQRDVLAHRNVVLFIYHGGLLGVTEAVHCGVPILGIPMFGDMGVNMAAVTSAGAGISLPFRDITAALLYNTINQMTSNLRYKQKAVELSRQFKDRPIPPLQSAVYWTEYVIRNKGAESLRAHQLSWYQLWFVDVLALLITFLTLAIVPSVLVTKRLIKFNIIWWQWKTKEQ